MAVEGRKLAPTCQGCWAYQALAWASVQRCGAAGACCAWRLGITASRSASEESQRRNLSESRFIAAPSTNGKEHSTVFAPRSSSWRVGGAENNLNLRRPT